MREDRAGLLNIPWSVLFQLDNLRGIREGSRRREYNSTTYCRQIERQAVRQANEQCYIPYDTENPTEQAINCCRLKIKMHVLHSKQTIIDSNTKAIVTLLDYYTLNQR